MKKSTPINLGTSNIYRIFWTYAIPSILMMIVQSTAGFINAIFVGRYIGSDGLAAITLVMPILMLLIGVGTMIAVGGTTISGIEKGAGNLEKSNNLFNVTTSLLFIVGLFGALAITIALPFLAKVTGAEGLVFDYTIAYGRYLAFFAPFFLVNFAFGFFLKLDGKPVMVVAIMLSGTVINILLSYLFVGRLGMGVPGAALATGAAQVLPFFVMLFVIITRSSWKFRLPKFHKDEIGRILFNGSSEFFSNIAFSLTGIIFNYVIMRRIGGNGVAAYAVAQQMAAIVGSIGYGLAEANQAAVSYNFGARQLKRVKKFRNMTFRTSFIVGLSFTVFFLLFGRNMTGIFVNEAETITMASDILGFYAFAFLFSGVNIAVGTYYTAIDDPVRSAAVTIYRSLIATVIGVTVLPMIFGENGIWMTVIFTEFSTIVLGTIMLKMAPFGRFKADVLQAEEQAKNKAA